MPNNSAPTLDDVNQAIMAKSAPTMEDINAAIEAKTSPSLMDRAKSFGNTTVENLPMIGGAIGGLMGTPAGGIGAIPGAAIGGAAGAGVRNIIRGFQDQGADYATQKPTFSGTMDAVNIAGKGAAQGVAQEMGGRLIGAATKSFAGSGIQDVSRKGVLDAAERLGITPTVGMMSKDFTTRGMESSLEQSPSIGGAMTRAQTVPVRQAISDASENLLRDASNSSNYETGVGAVKGISAKLGEKLNSAQMAYENFNQELPKMVPDFEAQAKLADDMANATKGNLSETLHDNYGEGVANKITNSTNLNDIEGIRKQVANRLSSAFRAGDQNAIDTLSTMQDKLEHFRDSQFVSQAQTAYPGPGGAALGKQMVQEYQGAKNGWANLYQDTKELGPIFGIKNKSPRAFVEAVTNITPEQMNEKLFTPNNIDKLNIVRENFPEQFAQIKALKLNEIKQASQTVFNGDEVMDPTKFLREVDKYSPEVQKALFGDGAQTISDIRTIHNAFPAKMGPSGTPQGISFMKTLDPGEVVRQPVSLAQRAFLNMRGSPTVNAIANSSIPSTVGKLGVGAAGTILNPGPQVNQNQQTPGYFDGGPVEPTANDPIVLDPEKVKKWKSGFYDGGTVQPSQPVQPSTPAEVAQASMRKAFHFAAGGTIPGAPQVPFNSPQNDNTLISATPGEVVLPLSVTQSSNAPQRAKEFMATQLNQQAPQGKVVQDPKTGPDKWAADGLQTLKSHVNDSDKEWIDANKGKLMLDPKAQNLLITASRFEPGSKPLDEILKHLKNRLEK